MRSRFAIWLYVAVALYVVFSNKLWEKNIYTDDSAGYYLYLPAVFIYHDLGDVAFYPALRSRYPSLPDPKFFLYNTGPGRTNDKYAIGTCLFQLPFFLLAHSVCLVTSSWPADGFSMPYQWAGILSAIFWVVAGLYVLKKMLSSWYPDPVVALTILGISLGTNLFHYSTYMPGLSHPYSFFLFAYVLYASQQWHLHHHLRHLFMLAVLLGLVAVTRPLNIVVAIIPIFWQVHDWQSLRQRLASARQYTSPLVVAFLFFAVIVAVQLSYWRYTAGHWVWYSYHEGFYFFHPHIYRGLFSYRKGWFVYTPLAFVGMAGFAALWRQRKELVPALLAFFGLLIYLVFSWKNWWYGGSFGCRPLIEGLAILSLPLAALFNTAWSRGLWLRVLSMLLIAACITLNIFQSWQFSVGIIHYDRMARAYYWRVFGRTDIHPIDYEQYLLDEHEYWREAGEISK